MSRAVKLAAGGVINISRATSQSPGLRAEQNLQKYLGGTRPSSALGPLGRSPAVSLTGSLKHQLKCDLP